MGKEGDAPIITITLWFWQTAQNSPPRPSVRAAGVPLPWFGVLVLGKLEKPPNWPVCAATGQSRLVILKVWPLDVLNVKTTGARASPMLGKDTVGHLAAPSAPLLHGTHLCPHQNDSGLVLDSMISSVSSNQNNPMIL